MGKGGVHSGAQPAPGPPEAKCPACKREAEGRAGGESEATGGCAGGRLGRSSRGRFGRNRPEGRLPGVCGLARAVGPMPQASLGIWEQTLGGRLGCVTGRNSERDCSSTPSHPPSSRPGSPLPASSRGRAPGPSAQRPLRLHPHTAAARGRERVSLLRPSHRASACSPAASGAGRGGPARPREGRLWTGRAGQGGAGQQEPMSPRARPAMPTGRGVSLALRLFTSG